MRIRYFLLVVLASAVQTKAQVDTALVLEWSSYFGGAADDRIQAMAVDPFGHIYVAGRTTGLWVMDTNLVHQDTMGGGVSDAFLAKFAPHGSLLWATYFGGPDMDEGTALAVDSVQGVFLVGNTLSDTMIATTDGAQTERAGSQDMFVALFDAVGSLIRATYVGGPADDGALDATMFAGSHVFICGWTASDSLSIVPDPPVYPHSGGVDGSLVEFDAELDPLRYSFSGGTGSDSLTGIATLDSIHLVVIGNTNSTSGLVMGAALQPSLAGGTDAFILRMDTALVMGMTTYFGGAMDDLGSDIASDSGRVMICGRTLSDSLHTDSTSFSRYRAGGSDAFLAALSDSLHLQWATLLGDTADDRSSAIAIDINGAVYVAGGTASADSIATAAMPQTALNGPWDAFVVKFDSANTRAWGTYLGGSATDDATRMHVIGETAVILSGWTNSEDSLSLIGHQMDFGGGITDGWAVRLQQEISTPCNGLCTAGHDGPFTSLEVCEGDAFTLIVFGGALGIGGEWMWYADNCGDPLSFIGAGDTLTYVPTDTMQVCVRAESALSTTTCTCIDIVPVPYPVLALTTTDSVCLGQPVELAGAGADTYLWTVGDSLVGATALVQFNAFESGSVGVILEGTNGMGCTATIMSSLTVWPLPEPVWSVVHPACPGDATGSIQLADADILGLDVFWIGIGSTDTMLLDLVAGTFTARVTDPNGCIVTQDIEVIDPPPLLDSLLVDPALCATPTGSAIAYAHDSTSVGYDWGMGFGTASAVSGLYPGAHYLTLESDIGCVFDTIFIVLPFGAIFRLGFAR